MRTASTTRAHVHSYQAHLLWQGSTATGYAGYGRAHQVRTPPAEHDLQLSADPAFRGDAALPNPEQLLLAAASSCQLLSFLAVAARAGVDVVAYEDDAEALMPTDAQPMRITQVVLRPQIWLSAGTDLELVGQLVARAHDECFIARSLTAQVRVEPELAYAAEATQS